MGAALSENRSSADRSTRDALMDEAIEQLMTKGVLAGLNLREVAEAVGVTPANIYHYFGSRQGLLRAALQRETSLLDDRVAALVDATFVERRLAMFDAIAHSPHLALTALLALDGDPDYQPMPFLDATRAVYKRQVEAHEIPADLDIEAAHLLGLAVSIGAAIYGDAAARQLHISSDELHERIRALFEQMMQILMTPRS
jgi:AcrR family transcriptional regulator